MKFCKNVLQRLVSLSDPSWHPYWVNYKMLKKLIKALPMMETQDDTLIQERRAFSAVFGEDSTDHSSIHIAQSQREVAFFKLLHAEFRKVCRFFERAQLEFTIREERIGRGIQILQEPLPSLMTDSHKWSFMARSIRCLYKELLLLETFAITSIVAFSKILKKHDKKVGYSTRAAYMRQFVEQSNFYRYSELTQMIARCKTWYEHVLARIAQEGLFEDERLFIGTIHQMQQQASEEAAREHRGRQRLIQGSETVPSLLSEEEEGYVPGPVEGGAVSTIRRRKRVRQVTFDAVKDRKPAARKRR